MPDLPDWSSAPVSLFQPTAPVTIQLTEAGVSGTVFVNGTGRGLVITQVQVVAVGGFYSHIRSVVVVNVGWNGQPPANVVAVTAISPEHPADIPSLDPSAAVVPSGQNITFFGYVQPGGGLVNVRIAATYYLTT